MNETLPAEQDGGDGAPGGCQTSTTQWWFITEQVWGGTIEMHLRNCVVDVHPIEWQQRRNAQLAEYPDHRVVLLFWTEIDEAQAMTFLAYLQRPKPTHE